MSDRNNLLQTLLNPTFKKWVLVGIDMEGKNIFVHSNELFIHETVGLLEVGRHLQMSRVDRSPVQEKK